MNNKLLERITLELYDSFGSRYAKNRLENYWLDDVITETDYLYSVEYLNNLLNIKQITVIDSEMEIILQSLRAMQIKYKNFGYTQQVKEYEDIINRLEKI